MAKRATYKEALSYGVASFAVLAVVTFASSIVTARLYGAEVVGQFALVMAPYTVLWVLSTVQEQAALVRELAVLKPRQPRVTALAAAIGTFSVGLTIVVASLLASLVVVLFRGPIDHPELVAPALVLLGSYVCLTNLSWNAISVLSAFRAGRQLFWIRLAQASTFLVMAVVLSFETDSVWALVLATIAAAVIELVLAVRAVVEFLVLRIPREELRAGFGHLRVMVAFGVKGTPGAIAGGLSDESGTWLLGLMGAPVAVIGAWSRASMVARRLLEANHKITEALFPTLMLRRSREDTEGFERAFVDTIRYLTAGLLLAAAVGGGGAQAVMWIFGPGFSAGADALALLLLVPWLYGVDACFGILLMAENRPLAVSAVNGARLLVTVLSSIPLIHWLGIEGAAIGLVLGYVATTGVLFAQSRRHLSRPLLELWPIRAMAPPLVAYVVAFAIGRVVDGATDGLPGLLLTMFAGTCAYLGAFILGGGIQAADEERVQRVLSALHSRRRPQASVA
jgi:O-antigen/teichoic acid export membrane protein